MREIDASVLSRYMNCSGAEALELRYTDFDAPPAPLSDDKREGMAAHAVVTRALRGNNPDDVWSLVGQTFHDYIVTEEMVETVLPHVWAMARTAPDDVLFVEEPCDWSIGGKVTVQCRLDVAKWNPQKGGLLVINEFKYGWRIIEPVKHWQMLAYAIGLCRKYNLEPGMIVFVVHQPRPFHPFGKIRQWVINPEQMTKYHAEIVMQLSESTGELATGSHCYKCPTAAACPALREASMSALDAVTKIYDDNLTGEQLGFELATLERAQTIIKERLDALQEAAIAELHAGRTVTGYDLEAAMGNTTWQEYVTADVLQMMAGIDPYERKIVTPAKAKKLGVPADVIQSLTHRPSKGVKLVRSNLTDKADKLFGSSDGTAQNN